MSAQLFVQHQRSQAKVLCRIMCVHAVASEADDADENCASFSWLVAPAIGGEHAEKCHFRVIVATRSVVSHNQAKDAPSIVSHVREGVVCEVDDDNVVLCDGASSPDIGRGDVERSAFGVSLATKQVAQTKDKFNTNTLTSITKYSVHETCWL